MNNVLTVLKSFIKICNYVDHCVFEYLGIISVVFPQDLLEKGLAADNLAMLGLGDIVIPGIFIALLLRFDVRYVVSRSFIFLVDVWLCNEEVSHTTNILINF